MKADILAKLKAELAEPIASERQIVYLLVEIRKLIELNQDKANFKALKFACDWAAHPILKGPEAQDIVRQFDKNQELIEAMNSAAPGQALTVDMSFLGPLGETMRLANFRAELSTYLKSQGLDSSLADDKARWTTFLKYYAGVIEDCPLKCVSQGLQFTDKVVLKVIDITPEATESTGHQLVIQWSWTSKKTGIETVNQQFY